MPDACPSGRRRAPSRSVVWSRPRRRSIPACTRPISAAHGSDDLGQGTHGARCRHEGQPFRRGRPAEADRCGRRRGAAVQANPFLKSLHDAVAHFATQGDGNHFFYVGRVASSGRVALVTHHGSRKPGACSTRRAWPLPRRSARGCRRRLRSTMPGFLLRRATAKPIGRRFRSIREWTKANHFAIHDRIAAALGSRIEDRFWNEHNFVFRRSDGLFYHAKGATPAWPISRRTRMA